MNEKEKIDGATVYDRLKSIGEQEDAMEKYFLRESLFIKQLARHIREADICKVFLRRYPIVYHRGTGACIKFRDFHVKSYQEEGKMDISLTVDVTMHDEEENQEIRETLYLSYPASFEKGYTQEEFDYWLDKQHEAVKRRYLFSVEEVLKNWRFVFGNKREFSSFIKDCLAKM